MWRLRTLDRLDARRKRVLLRLDLELDYTGLTASLEASLPTIKELLSAQASVIICGNVRRPANLGKAVPSFESICRPLANLLSDETEVNFCGTSRGPGARLSVKSLVGGDVLVLENLAFEPGDVVCDRALSEDLAALADVFVNDSLNDLPTGSASTLGVSRLVPAFAGRRLQKELEVVCSVVRVLKQPLELVIASEQGINYTLLRRLIAAAGDVFLEGPAATWFLREGSGRGRVDDLEVGTPLLIRLNLELEGGIVSRPRPLGLRVTSAACGQDTASPSRWASLLWIGSRGGVFATRTPKTFASSLGAVSAHEVEFSPEAGRLLLQILGRRTPSALAPLLDTPEGAWIGPQTGASSIGPATILHRQRRPSGLPHKGAPGLRGHYQPSNGKLIKHYKHDRIDHE